MSRTEYRFDGLDALEQQLSRMIEEEYPAEFRKMVIQIARELQGKIKEKTPHKTGRLQEGWNVGPIVKRGDTYYIEVYNNVEYAEPVEYGHRTRGGRGFVPGKHKYGVVQAVYKHEDGTDAQTEAKALLKTLEQSGSVTGCQGDSRAVSGYALIVQETTTELFGKFYIESDTHTFTDGKHEMTLTLAFSNMMDEKEIENQSQG